MYVIFGILAQGVKDVKVVYAVEQSDVVVTAVLLL